MKRTAFLLVASLMITLAATAQQSGYIKDGALLDGKTIVKANVSSPFLNTVGFTGERILTKNLSVVLGTSFMPSGPFPYINKIMDMTDADEETRDILSSVKINTFSFSPELRIYTGKGYGKGFYISPYYRYEKFGLKNLSTEFTVENEGVSSSEDILFSGGLKTHSVGLMFGYQWLLGKNNNIVIDWTMLGGHYGTNSGNLNGKYQGDAPLTEENRQEAQQSLNEALADIPIIEAKGAINSDNSVDITTKGPWAFLRGSLSIGFRF